MRRTPASPGLAPKARASGPRRLVELLGVEARHAQRVLDLREVRIDRPPLEVLRRAREALGLGLHHAQVEVGAGQGRVLVRASSSAGSAGGAPASAEHSSATAARCGRLRAGRSAR